ncbi:MAG: class I SAM-dependent methyltransferase [Deltaproteobacteria bacterium]|nr:MAG: class I SAM-dependent methyltransferase [Deltaproteobacteria bacterium]
MLHRQLTSLRAGELTLRDAHFGDARFGAASDLSATVDVRDGRFYRAVALGGSVGAARAFMRGDWDSDDLVAVFRLFARDRAASDRLETGPAAALGAVRRAAHRLRSNTPRRARRNVSAHYDLGNDFFALFLDPSLTYSAAFYDRPHATLADAQRAKIDRLCRKLDLSRGDHLLEIGTGWGSLAIRAAQTTGCRVTTATLSAEQAALARRRVAEAGLTGRVHVVVADYRELDGRYDKLVSVEMVEAVGHDHLDAFFRVCGQRLRPGGTMALQAITVPDQRYAIARRQVDVIQQLVFPGADIPSVGALLAAAARASDLRVVHLEDNTPHYARTLRDWRARFRARRDDARALGYAEAFLRLWDLYLAYCEAGFAEHYTASVQLVLRRPRA